MSTNTRSRRAGPPPPQVEPHISSALTYIESLILAQAVWELGANSWPAVAKLLSKHPLISRPKSFFTAQACHLLYNNLMDEAGIERVEENALPHAPLNLRLAQKHYQARLTELRDLIAAEEAKFKTIISEIQDIRSGLWDDKIKPSSGEVEVESELREALPESPMQVETAAEVDEADHIPVPPASEISQVADVVVSPPASQELPEAEAPPQSPSPDIQTRPSSLPLSVEQTEQTAVETHVPHTPIPYETTERVPSPVDSNATLDDDDIVDEEEEDEEALPPPESETKPTGEEEPLADESEVHEQTAENASTLPLARRMEEEDEPVMDVQTNPPQEEEEEEGDDDDDKAVDKQVADVEVAADVAGGPEEKDGQPEEEEDTNKQRPQTLEEGAEVDESPLVDMPSEQKTERFDEEMEGDAQEQVGDSGGNEETVLAPEEDQDEGQDEVVLVQGKEVEEGKDQEGGNREEESREEESLEEGVQKEGDQDEGDQDEGDPEEKDLEGKDLEEEGQEGVEADEQEQAKEVEQPDELDEQLEEQVEVEAESEPEAEQEREHSVKSEPEPELEVPAPDVISEERDASGDEPQQVRRSSRRRKSSVLPPPPTRSGKGRRGRQISREADLSPAVENEPEPVAEGEGDGDIEMRDEDGAASPPVETTTLRRGKRKASFVDTAENLRDKKRVRDDSEPADEEEPGPSSAISRTRRRTEEQVALKRFQNVIGMLHSQISQHRNGNIFHNPIKNSEAPDYHEIVKRPIDLKTIKAKVKDGVITNSLEYQRDIYLMFANALMYNRPGSDVYVMAEDMMVESEGYIQTFRQTEGYVRGTHRSLA